MQRHWTVELDPQEGIGYDELQDAVLDLTTILIRCGGVGAVAPHRVETADGDYIVDRVLLRYDSYAPGLNKEPTEQVEAIDENLATVGAENGAEIEPAEKGEPE